MCFCVCFVLAWDQVVISIWCWKEGLGYQHDPALRFTFPTTGGPCAQDARCMRCVLSSSVSLSVCLYVCVCVKVILLVLSCTCTWYLKSETLSFREGCLLCQISRTRFWLRLWQDIFSCQVCGRTKRLLHLTWICIWIHKMWYLKSETLSFREGCLLCQFQEPAFGYDYDRTFLVVKFVAEQFMFYDAYI